MRYRLTLMICALALGALAPAQAAAQGGLPPAAGDAKAQARALANKGFELYEAGKYEEAVQSFVDAEKTFHAPTILLMIARANDKLGKLLEAQAVYRRIVDEELANYAPPEFFEAQRAAKAELAALTERIPTVEVAITGTDSAQITVDGAPAVADVAVPVEPGSHTIVVSAPGQEEITRTITLEEGAREHVSIDVAGSTQGPDVPDDSASKGSIVPALVAFGVGGAALGVGAVTGALTLGKVGDLEDECNGNVCPTEYTDDYDSAHTLATVSTVGFIVAGAAAAAGVVLLFVRPGQGQPAQAGIVVSPGYVGVRGTF